MLVIPCAQITGRVKEREIKTGPGKQVEIKLLGRVAKSKPGTDLCFDLSSPGTH